MAEGTPAAGHAASTGHALRAAASRHAVQAAPSRDATATWHATSPPLRGRTPAVPLTIELAIFSIIISMLHYALDALSGVVHGASTGVSFWKQC